jgi:hypothetical protein
VRDHATENEGNDVKHRLFSILSTVSLGLCVATCVMWVGSYFHVENYGFRGQNPHSQLTSDCGRVLLFRVLRMGGVGYHPWFITHHDWYAKRSGKYWLGFYLYRTVRTTIYGVPDWFLFALTLPLSFVRLRAVRQKRAQHRRLVKKLCVMCGYDLRATPDRCPECGAVPTGPMVTA